MSRRNRPTRRPQRSKLTAPARVVRMFEQVLDDTQAALIFMSEPRR